MIDLHCHLLPGVDDGPGTLAESLELCRIAVADGTTRAVVTPHIHPGRWENSRATVGRACAELQRELDGQGIPLQLGFAGEVRVTDAIPAQVDRGDIPFYGEVDGYRIMLLEFPHGHIVPGSEKLARWLLDRGVRPLIAHPERNRQVMRDPSELQPYLDLGCWLQVTAGSVTGQFGERCEAVARGLLARDAVHVLASDGHNDGARPPVLRKAYECVALAFGESRAQRLFVDTPALLTAAQWA
jgi:protein-tyrosine phosphatase